tara:strand:- start:13370 stop:13837 length:468 start_codon:yes stop_codon:yes gene_type:complete
MKITKNELKEIIREEALKFKRKIELENELNEVQSQINEVTGGPGTHFANDTAGTMYDKNVTLKGGALVEDETEITVGDDGGGDTEITVGPDESYMSEEALEEMLAEIMSEGDDEEELPEDEEPFEEGIYEEEEVSEEVISEEMRRMKELAGILKS